MKRKYPQLIDLLTEGKIQHKIVSYDTDGVPVIELTFIPEKEVGDVINKMVHGEEYEPKISRAEAKQRKNRVRKFFNELADRVKQKAVAEPGIEFFKKFYNFKIGSTYGGSGAKALGQKLRAIPITGTDVPPITFLVLKDNAGQDPALFARIPGQGGFINITTYFQDFANEKFVTENFVKYILSTFKDLGPKISIDEGLSRGSLYRRRYYGRY